MTQHPDLAAGAPRLQRIPPPLASSVPPRPFVAPAGRHNPGPVGARPASLSLVRPEAPVGEVSRRKKGPRWVTVVLVTFGYAAAYALAWFVVNALS